MLEERKVGGNYMRKHIIICSIGIFLVCLLSSACVYNAYRKVRPQAYGAAKWFSDDPDIWFEVTTPPNDSSDFDESLYGEMVLDDKIIKIAISFDPAKSMFIWEVKGVDQYKQLLIGSCRFGSKKLRVRIDTDHYDILNGKYDEITFVRTELTDSQISAE